MTSTIRIGEHELQIRATGSTLLNLPELIDWLDPQTVEDFCTVFPTYTIHHDFNAGNRIVRTDTGAAVHTLPEGSSEDVLDYNHVVVGDEVINMETLEICTPEEWAAHKQPALMQVILSQHMGSHEATMVVTDHCGSTSDLPFLRIANCPNRVFFGVVDNFLVVVNNPDNPAVFTPIARGNLALELKEVIGNFHIFQTRGLGLHTKPAARRCADDE